MKDSRDGEDAIRKLDGYVFVCLFCKDHQREAVVQSHILQDGIWAPSASVEGRVGKGADAQICVITVLLL